MADKALLLGINEYKNVNHLRGCVNDVENMRKLLTDAFAFDANNVRHFINDGVTKDAVKKQMKWLFQGMREGDRVVFHFSGHGSRIPNPDKAEDVDLICLYDMDFHDPDSYFINHELRDWSKLLPKGVQLTFVLDCCHSGEGTRLLMAPMPGQPFKEVPVRLVKNATIQRSYAKQPASLRGADAAAAHDAALDPQHEDAVLARFVDPPPAMKEAVARRRLQFGQRELVVTAQLNHVLLAACTKIQTAADATIGGQPNGAFTYYLCKTLRDGGASIERKELIARLEKALKAGHFDQAPQLEVNSGVGPLFASARMSTDTDTPTVQPVTVGSANPAAPVNVDQLANVIAQITRLSKEAQLEALRGLWQTLGIAPTAGRAARGAGDRFLVYVHGICKHVSGFSDEWWNALHEFVPDAFSDGTLGEARREVLWSDLVNERGLAARGLRAARAVDGEHERAANEIREALQDRLDRHTLDAGPRSIAGEAPRALSDPRGLLSIPGLNCVDDFTVYLVNDSVRAQIIARFTDEVRPLLASGAELDVISHSWGTVVAYEALRELEDQGLTTPRIRNWFTVGAALSIAPVKFRLRPANHDGRRPAPVRRWVNLNAHGDIVGGVLKDRPYQVDDDFPNLDPFGCGHFLGLINPACAHGSYFTKGNDAVNRDVFAAFIDQP